MLLELIDSFLQKRLQAASDRDDDLAGNVRIYVAGAPSYPLAKVSDVTSLNM